MTTTTNQKQAQETTKVNVGEWYVNSTVAMREQLIEKQAIVRGWTVGFNGIYYLGHRCKLRIDDGRFFEIFKKSELVFDADFRWLCPDNVAQFLEGVEGRIKACLTMKNYDVSVSRDTAEEITIRVTAYTAEQASSMAKEEALYNHDLEWSQSSYIGDVQTDNVTLAEDEQSEEGAPEHPQIIPINQPVTNVEFISDLMTFSNYGALAQAFVMDALYQHAKQVAHAENLDLGSMAGIINAAAWQGVAQEIQHKIEQRNEVGEGV